MAKKKEAQGSEAIDASHRVIAESGLFDEAYYRRTIPVGGEFDAVLHYLLWGAPRGMRPRVDFDPSVYAAVLAEAGEAPIYDPFDHFVRFRSEDDLPQVAAGDIAFLEDYRDLERSGTFDAEAYLSELGPVLQCDPIEHYLRWSWRSRAAAEPARTGAAVVDDEFPGLASASDLIYVVPDSASYADEDNTGSAAQAFNPTIQQSASIWDGLEEPGEDEAVPDAFEDQRQVIADSGLFDEAHYRAKLGIDTPDFDLLGHYLQWGSRQGLWPRPDFDPAYYAGTTGGAPAVEGLDPFAHFVRHHGAQDLPVVAPELRRFILDAKVIRDSGLFDDDHYRQILRVSDPHFDCIEHYLKWGSVQGLDPRPDFETAYYQQTMPPEAQSADENPFAHFLRTKSEADLPMLEPSKLRYHNDYRDISESGLFDEEFYRKAVDVQDPKFDCIEHYLRWGMNQGLRPRSDFDPAFYESRYPDVLRSVEDPFAHFVRVGQKEARLTDTEESQVEDSVRGGRSRSFEAMRPAEGENRVQSVAFYLPQFHPIRENDEWWGKGFTEWTNVTRAQPLYPNHAQPLLPGDLGFYDLRLKENLEAQVKLAKAYRLDAFCFYYYWFQRHRLLERPLDMFADSPDLDREFCICWANENWSRRWDGSENEILISQKHSVEDDNAVIADMARYLRNPRYLRINGKPLLLVYRPDILPECSAMLERWRKYAREEGLGELLLASCLTFGSKDPKALGFDLAVEFPPHNLTNLRSVKEQTKFFGAFQGNIFSYPSYCKETVANPPKSTVPTLRGAMVKWDNTARRGPRATIFDGATPQLFQQTLSTLADQMQATGPDHPKTVFINAWNEWAESAVLEPDRRHGYAYLNAFSRALTGKKTGSVLVVAPEANAQSDVSEATVSSSLLRQGADGLICTLAQSDISIDCYDLVLAVDRDMSASRALDLLLPALKNPEVGLAVLKREGELMHLNLKAMYLQDRFKSLQLDPNSTVKSYGACNAVKALLLRTDPLAAPLKKAHQLAERGSDPSWYDFVEQHLAAVYYANGFQVVFRKLTGAA